MVAFGPAYGPTSKFQFGSIVTTLGALQKIPPKEIDKALSRHLSRDWGELEGDDWFLNDRALVVGGRLFSEYSTEEGEKFWIITSSDRSVTTVLLPREY